VTIVVDDTGIPIDMTNDIALTPFRVMQEAVRNAVKHSAVRDVTVSVAPNQRPDRRLGTRVAHLFWCEAQLSSPSGRKLARCCKLLRFPSA
jgi:hypothetical protein